MCACARMCVWERERKSKSMRMWECVFCLYWIAYILIHSIWPESSFWYRFGRENWGYYNRKKKKSPNRCREISIHVLKCCVCRIGGTEFKMKPGINATCFVFSKVKKKIKLNIKFKMFRIYLILLLICARGWWKILDLALFPKIWPNYWQWEGRSFWSCWELFNTPSFYKLIKPCVMEHGRKKNSLFIWGWC